ncbi:hypothetical protein AB0O28_11115 [Microbispora sp. NPDC088329]
MSLNIGKPEAEDGSMADDLLVLAKKIRSRGDETELTAEFLYDAETGLPS